jgi:hypothetical protein
MQELRLEPGADPQKVLAELMKRGRVLHFELARPSLQDIFVRIAAPDAAEVADKAPVLGAGLAARD